MKKTLFVMVIIVLACILSAGLASAEYGYTRVSDIPMAVDFTYSVEFAEDGTPHIQTDYPFEETGAMKMDLIYEKTDQPTGLRIFFDPVTKQSVFGNYKGDSLPKQACREAARMIRDGEMILDCILIETLYDDPDTDWWRLEYSVPRQQYRTYTENTFSPSYNKTDPNGKRSLISISYSDGVMFISSNMIRPLTQNTEELILVYDAYGKLIPSTYILKTYPELYAFHYDPETGLCDGKRIDELCLEFTEADLQVPAPAALDPVE